jgi:outer membrane immunogenic protein
MAADMPVKASVVSTWTGFYFGVDVGYGWARPSISDLQLRANPDLFSPGPEADALSFHAPNLRGALFGGHAGFNWQWSQRGVVGLEIDYSAANLNAKQGATFDLTSDSLSHIDSRTLTTKLDSLASARARFGYLLSPDVLLYGTGGAAWAHTRLIDTITFHDVKDNTNLVFTGRASANPFGWVAGAGAEWRLWDYVMLRVEYLHYGFGGASPSNVTVDNNGGLSRGGGFNIPLDRLSTDVVRGGVSYKF